MLLVVFGAGASYDSAPSHRVPNGRVVAINERIALTEQNRPPLANGLFENRGFFAETLKKFHCCQPLVPRLRHLPQNRSLEQVLATYSSEAELYPERHKQIMAVRYYLAYVIRACEQQWEGVHKGVTNHNTLLDQIEKWRCHNKETVCLVTFNYDTMVEAAFRGIGVRFEKLPDYISGQKYKFFKLHGSVDWAHAMEMPLNNLQSTDPQAIADEVIERAAALKFYNQYVMVRDQPPPPDHSVGLVTCPAIAVPVENKSQFECPTGHIDELKRCLPQVTKMLTIGWRATEEHFLRLLREDVSQQPNLMVVAGNQKEASEIAERLQPRRLNVDLGTGGFTVSVLSRAIEEFLDRGASAPILRDSRS